MQRTVSYRQPRPWIWALAAILIGCTPAPVGPLPDADGVVREFLYTPGQNMLISRDPTEIPDVAEAATRVSVAEIAQRRRTDEVRLDQLAYFFRAAAGRDYLLADEPKAMVRGEPQAQCPVQTFVLNGAPTTGDAITQALGACHAALDELGREADCDCRLLAHDYVLRADPAMFEYAVDLPVRLFRSGQLDPVTYFSRAGSDEAGNLALVIEIGEERLMVATYADPAATQALVTFADGRQSTAVRTPVGYDRGRLRQSFTLNDPDGAPLRIIVGP